MYFNFEENSGGFLVPVGYKKQKTVNVGVKNIYYHIKTHQAISAKSLAEYFDTFTQRTIERWIKELKDDNKIIFKGATKTGGYFVK